MHSPALALLLVLGMLPAASAEQFRIDPRHTFPVFEVSHHGFSLQRGRFNRTHGTILLDRSARRGTIDVTIEADSIDMGLDEWSAEMRSERFFDVDRHPHIRFRSQDLSFDADRPYSARGLLTLLGESRPVELEIADFHCATNPLSGRLTCGANVSTTIRRSEFGMEALLPGIGDEVRIHIGIEAVLQEP